MTKHFEDINVNIQEESDDFRILSENDNQLKFARKLFTG